MPNRDFWCTTCGKKILALRQQLKEEPPICCGIKMQQYWEKAPTFEIKGLRKDRFK